MNGQRITGGAALLLALLAAPPVQAQGGDRGCTAFRWNVAAERALFATTGTALTAGGDAASAATLPLAQLATVSLPVQDTVDYRLPPAKLKLADGAHGGLLRFTVPKDGEYRIALSSAHWVDVVDDATLLPSLDFHGASGCAAPRKLVRYRLPAGRPLLLQLSGAVDATVSVTVTPEP